MARRAFQESHEAMQQAIVIAALSRALRCSIESKTFTPRPSFSPPPVAVAVNGTKGAGAAVAAPEMPDNNVISKREREVLRLIVDGKSTRDIAKELGVSFKTAACHRANLMSKLDVHETASLVMRAIRWGLVDL